MISDFDCARMLILGHLMHIIAITELTYLKRVPFGALINTLKFWASFVTAARSYIELTYSSC